MTVKKERLQSIILKEVSSIIFTEVKNPDIGLPTVTDVELTNDYSIAKIFVTFMDDEKYHQKHLEALEDSKGLIRSKLAKVLSIRKCPSLIFKIDNSLAYGNKIESIINELNKDVNEETKDE